MAFFTIHIAPGLSERDYQRALASGPSAVSTLRRDHAGLLAAAGFTNLRHHDLTPAFLRTARAWHHGRERYAAELTAAEGPDQYHERQIENGKQLAALEAGLLSRSLFVCW